MPHYQNPTNPHRSNNHVNFRQDYVKSTHDFNNDIKQSNISQQTIIHKAHLYSPDKNYERYDKQPNQKTKTKKQIQNRIHEIVGLCENGYEDEVREFQEVIHAERKILGMLREDYNDQQPVPSIDLSNFHDNYERGTTFGPIRHDNYGLRKVQSKPITQRGTTNVKGEKHNPRDNIYKKSAIDDLKTDRNIQESPEPQMPKNYHKKFSENFDSDGVYQAIQQIQKKATEEIQGLRQDKIQLMRRLNEQIRAHNEQKKLRLRLEEELASLKGQPLRKQGQGHKTQKTTAIHTQQSQKIPLKSYSQSQIPNNVINQYPFSQNETNFSTYDDRSIPTANHQYGYDQNEAIFQQEIQKLQKVKHSARPERFETGSKNYQQKNILRSQIAALNQKIRSYKFKLSNIQRGRAGNNEQLHQLLDEGEQIGLETLRLLSPSKSPFPARQQKLPQHDSITKISSLSKKQDGRSSLPVNSVSRYGNEKSRILEFESIIGQMRSAAK